jgi:hypothetical protein
VQEVTVDYRVDEAAAILSRTSGTLQALLCGMPESWVRANYGEGTFSPFDVVGHLIHGEKADWIPRARAILEQGESQPFEPFDRFAMFEASKGKTMEELLDEFEVLRRENLEILRAMDLGADKLELIGRHPEFGPVSLRALLASWVVHDLDHLAQIARALAYQYKEAAGPWRSYMAILG